MLLVCVTFVAYMRIFYSGFIESYDDEMYITLNPAVLQGFTWASLKWSLTTFVSGNWHPITWWSHLIDVSLFGLNPAGHHGVNLGFHIINTVLLYFLLLRTTGKRGCSLAVAALFGVHPLHVESVAWVAERKDVLSSLFAIWALHAYLKFATTERMRYFLLLFVLLCCSLMAKPMMVTLPFVLLLLDYWPLARYRTYRWHTLVMEKLLLLVPVAIISGVTIVAQQSAGALKGLADDSLAVRAGNALHAYFVYLKKFLIPYDLASFYPFTEASPGLVIVSSICLAVVTFWVWRCRWQRQWLLVGWGWFLMTLVPVIGIIRVGEQAYADRYMYLPMVGISIMLVWGGDELLQRFRVPHVFTSVSVGCLLAGYTVVTSVQTGYWRDSFTLYTRELEVTKDNWHGHFGLANVLAKRQEYEEAARHYRAVLILKPDLLDAHNNLGGVLRSLGRYQEAMPHFIRAMEINPYYMGAYFNLALTMMENGDRAAAVQVLGRALAIDPSFREAQELQKYLEK